MPIAKQITAALRALTPASVRIVEATFLLAGAGLVAYGAWLVYVPAGYITGGVLVIAGVILNARGKGG